MGAINFGMLDDSNKGTDGRTVVIAVGVLTVANALFNCLVICNHPAFIESKKKEMTEEDIIAYIKSHPEVAAKAASSSAFESTPAQETAVNVFAQPSSGAGTGAAAAASGPSAAYVPPSSQPSGECTSA